MSRLNSLKFLLLHKLNKNSSKMSKDIHKEIAYSLNITLNDERFNGAQLNSYDPYLEPR